MKTDVRVQCMHALGRLIVENRKTIKSQNSAIDWRVIQSFVAYPVGIFLGLF